MPRSAEKDEQSTGGPSPEAGPSVSVIVPTYREAGNLPELIRRVEQVRIASELALELLILDDDSDDGTPQVVEGLKRDWVRLIVRKDARDLSSAVLEGLRQARGEIAVVMDADLSHPPETIPHVVRAIADGADFAIGSRYVAGGSTDAAWGPLRWLNSRIATWLARPLTSAKDPMSGFFAIRRERVGRAVGLDPIGYKIGLELLVRCGCRDVREVPIHFADRKAGKSKLSFKQQLRYVRHLKRLMMCKYPRLPWIAAGVVVVLAVVIAVLVAR
jgi:dolichol-phosphate mannosyltransferase